MEFNVTREQWIDRFMIHRAFLETGAEPADFAAVASTLWESSGQRDPIAVADEEHASRARIGAQATSAPAAGEETRFERTERIPVEHVQTAGEYVRDTGEWIARCVKRVLELDPIIKADEAQRSVADLAALERWRLMKPEAAAEQLYTPIRPRG